MSEHGDHFPTTPVQCACGWRETDPDAGTWVEHMTSVKPPVVGYVQRARWGEWEAVCTVARCAWRSSRGLRGQADAEQRLRDHADLVHPPRIPVTQATRSASGAERGQS